MIIIKKTIIISILPVVLIAATFFYFLATEKAETIENIRNTISELNTVLGKEESPTPDKLFLPAGVIIKHYISRKELAIRTMEEGSYWNCGGGRNTTPFLPDNPGLEGEGIEYTSSQFLAYSQKLGLKDILCKEVTLTDKNTAVVEGSIISGLDQNKRSEGLSLTLVRKNNLWLIREIFLKFAYSD